MQGREEWEKCLSLPFPGRPARSVGVTTHNRLSPARARVGRRGSLYASCACPPLLASALLPFPAESV
jgi:hypothetical protein